MNINTNKLNFVIIQQYQMQNETKLDPKVPFYVYILCLQYNSNASSSKSPPHAPKGNAQYDLKQVEVFRF